MNWKQTLFKPKWQHKNPDIRLACVESEQDPRLISSLLEIARDDADPRVRRAAIGRLHRLENLLKIYTVETDAPTRKLLEQRIRQLASNTSETRPPLALRMEIANTTVNRELIEHLAAYAPEAELRRAALVRVERQGFLGDCCLNDTDADNRSLAAGRINQLTTLKRVIDGLRKRDKALHARLKERLHHELLEQGDPGAVQEEAVRICTALEKLAIETGPRDESAEAAAHADWRKLPQTVSRETAARYQRICERLAPVVAADPEPVPKPDVEKPDDSPSPATQAQETPEKPAAINSALQQVVNDIRQFHEQHQRQPSASIVEKLRKRLDKAQQRDASPQEQALLLEAGNMLGRLETTLAKLQAQREKILQQARELLTRLQQELDDGELHKALITRASLQKLDKERPKDKRHDNAWKVIRRSLTGMQGRLRELREWHHWSNNKIRKRLIAEMELLPAASDLHPDALLDRIKSLQAEWKALEASEQIPGEKHFAAAPWMWRKFSAAGHAAFDTVRPFLDKRSEIQSREAQSLATFCAELEQLAEQQEPDWTALGKGLSRGRRKLRNLNNIPARQRHKLARKLKSALDKANNAMQAHYGDVEKEKKKLIRAASQLSHLPEKDEAIAQAKALQAQWKAAGSLWRSAEQKLWTQFREYLDPLFDELKEKQASIRAADKEKLAAQKALCDELGEILRSAPEQLPGHHGKVQGLEDAWRDIRHADRKLLQRFQTMVADYHQRVEAFRTSQVNADRDRWWLKSGLLHRYATAPANDAAAAEVLAEISRQWPAESSDEPVEQRMDQHFQGLAEHGLPASDPEVGESLQQQARALCIRLEFLAGLPSPDEEREQRMQYQVDRLAESMAGSGTRVSALEEANDAERTWLGMYTLSKADYDNFSQRVKQALATIIVTK